ncbi:hypothetical protein GCM10023350_07360 [Nocardioides endophyticus]|uniref:DUF1707 domain-containing protein n=1 Tax=Nocardioides endophyticus TaxID=1353775 RepID=A0ABP8YDA2_9ACTN
MSDMLSELNDEDRGDFLARLEVFGVDESAIIARDVITQPGTFTTLTTRQDTASDYRPVMLRTNDLDKVNRWIGVPDSTFDRTEPIVPAPSSGRGGLLSRFGPGGGSAREHLRPTGERRAETKARTPEAGEDVQPADLVGAQPASSMSSEDYAELRMAGRAYLRGDSRKVAAYRTLIELAFPVIEIPLWPIFNVLVKSGSVLEFGPGPHALVAYSVTIERGGIVRSYGDLTISATILRRTIPKVKVPFDEALLRGRVFGGIHFEG